MASMVGRVEADGDAAVEGASGGVGAAPLEVDDEGSGGGVGRAEGCLSGWCARRAAW